MVRWLLIIVMGLMLIGLGVEHAPANADQTAEPTAGHHEPAAVVAPRLTSRAAFDGVSTQANAQNVELVGQISGSINAVAVRGRYAYIGDGSRLVILDIADPTHPTVVGQTAVLPGIIRDLTVVDNYAYIAASDSDSIWSPGSLQVIDVTIPAWPVEIGFCTTPIFASGVTVMAGYAYVAAMESGLRIINVANPAMPVETGFHPTSQYTRRATVAGGVRLCR